MTELEFKCKFLGIDPKKVKDIADCDHCGGYGSSLKEDQDTCSECGGTGLIVTYKEV